MLYHLRYLFCLLLLLVATACLEEIDLEVPADLENAIVIEGTLIKGNPSVVEVKTSRLFTFSAASRTRVNLLSLTLYDTEGNSIDIPERNIGDYRLELGPEAAVQIEEGKGYYIRAATFDGRVIESAPDSILPVPEATSLQVNDATRPIDFGNGGIQDVPFFEFRINTPLVVPGQQQGSRLLWRSERSYRQTDSPLDGVMPKTCYITQTTEVDNIPLADATLTNTDMVENLQVYATAKETFFFAEGYYLTVYQQSLTEAAFEYWRQVKELINRTGSLFEPPAGQLFSNLKNIEDPTDDSVIGIFYATQQDTIRVYVSPERAGNVRTLCPPQGPSPPRPCPLEACCDCLTVQGSEAEQPDFWEE